MAFSSCAAERPDPLPPSAETFQEFFTRLSQERDIKAFLEPAARLDWILGFADDAPEKHITALFSPIIYCIERAFKDSSSARVVAVQPRGAQRFTRTCKMTRLNWLSLGQYYAYDGKLQHPLSIDLPVKRLEYHKRRITLIPENGSLYIAGGQYELPERLQKAAQLHAPLADGITFFAASDAEGSGVTVLIPCTEILRSCYGYFGDYLHSIQQPARHMGVANARPESAYGYTPALRSSHITRAKHVRRMFKQEPNQMFPRALIYGRRGTPRPILVRPPQTGKVVIGGEGFSYHDDLGGEVVVIVSRLSIETQFAHDFSQRRQQRWLDTYAHTETFAPVFSNDHVMLVELNAKAPHGCSEAVENYDIHGFSLQLHHLDEVFSDPFGIHELAVLRDMRNWRFTFWKDGGAKHHSVALSASFVKPPRRQRSKR